MPCARETLTLSRRDVKLYGLAKTMSRPAHQRHEHQPPTAEMDEFHRAKTQSRAPLMTEPSANQSVVSVEVPLKLPLEDPDPGDRQMSEHMTRQDLASPRQKLAGLETSQHTKDEHIAALEASAMDSKQLAFVADTNEHEDEELPPQFQNLERIGSKPELHAKSDAHYSRNGRYGPHRGTATEESPGFLKSITNLVFSRAQSSPLKPVLQRQQESHLRASHAEQSQRQLEVKGSMSKRVSKDEVDEVTELRRNIKMLEMKERSWAAKQRELESSIKQKRDEIEQMNDKMERSMQACRAKIQKAESKAQLVLESYETFIRKQQEDSFRQMESARWLPAEESKVTSDLDRLKREMKSWAKGAAINNIAILESVEETDYVALLNDLTHVVLLENNQLPSGLSTSKSPALLLNALLAHSVFMRLFRNPFFFLEDGLGDNLPRPGLECLLDEIYYITQRANQEDAHIWRSQTLRLLLPPLRTDTSNNERELRSWTEELIANVAHRHASNFLQGSAQYLISEEAKANCSSKLQAIYKEAGTLSYMLWTRRTAMRCFTLHDLNSPRFDPDSESLTPHTSVKYDDHEDQLKGRPISVFLHPLLMVYGTDEAKEYDRERVWASAEVWLDSRKSPTS